MTNRLPTTLPALRPIGRFFACCLLAIIILLGAVKSLWAQADAPFELPQRAELLKIRSAILETSSGKIFLELFPEEAPWHVANFKYLADKGFYNGLFFHLYQPGYMIQGGDPRGNGFGGPGYSLPPEFSNRHHSFGTLGMARTPDVYDKKGRPINPERRSSGSQFYLILEDAPHLDGKYTIFGKVVGGMKVLSSLRKGDKIKKLTVFIREGGR